MKVLPSTEISNMSSLTIVCPCEMWKIVGTQVCQTAILKAHSLVTLELLLSLRCAEKHVNNMYSTNDGFICRGLHSVAGDSALHLFVLTIGYVSSTLWTVEGNEFCSSFPGSQRYSSRDTTGSVVLAGSSGRNYSLLFFSRLYIQWVLDSY